MAIKGFEIILAPEAVDDLKHLKAYVRSTVRDALERHLRYEPRRGSRSRIKRLRGLAQPQFRMRVGNVRVFYDVVENRVEILAIVSKPDAAAWLNRWGKLE